MQTIENNMGTINLNDFSVKWTDAVMKTPYIMKLL